MGEANYEPPWKRNLRPPTPQQRTLAAETRRAKASVKEALLNAFDKLGNEAFFFRLGMGSAEDQRCLAMILAKLLPLEVQGSLDANLVVKIVTQVGETYEMDVTIPRATAPQIAAAKARAVPAPAAPGDGPAEPPDDA